MDESVALKVDRNPTLRELALEKMREAILALRFQPGDRLVERQLCESLGVSRTIVREVLRHLESEGLVEVLQNRGPIVAKPTIEEIRQIYELRAMLEGLAARTCAEIGSPQAIAALEKALQNIKKAYAQRSFGQEVLQATAVFYECLFHEAGKTVAWNIVSSLNARMNHLRAMTIRAPNRKHEGPAALAAIVDAIKKKKPEAAVQACLDHAAEAAKLAEDYLSAVKAPEATAPGVKTGAKRAKA